MQAAWQIEEWKKGRAVLARQLKLLVSGKMEAGDKVLRDTTAKSIRHLKSKIAALDAMIEKRPRKVAT
jgi:hypothetical protein